MVPSKPPDNETDQELQEAYAKIAALEAGADKRNRLVSGEPFVHAHLLHLFIEHSTDAVAMFDRDMRYLAVSRRWIADYRLEGQELIGRSHYEVFPEIPDQWKDIHQRCLAGESLSQHHDRFARQDGRVDWLTWQIHPWHNEDGSIGGIIMFTQLANEQAEYKEALGRNEAYLRTMNDNLPDAVFTVKMPERKIEYVNHTVAHLFGYSENEVIGQTTRLFYASDEAFVAFGEKIRDALEQGLRSIRVETELVTKQGRLFWASIATAFIFMDEILTQVVSIVTDVSFRKEAERTQLENERLRIALEKEKELADLRTQFITTISHELRTPLTSILVSTTMLDQYADEISQDKREIHFSTIRRQLDYLENTLRQISLGMQAERGYLTPDPRPISPDLLYSNVKALAYSQMTEHHTLKLTCNRVHDGMLQLDEELLHHVLVNLISNAVKYSPTGGEIEVEMDCSAHLLSVKVRDEGMGISEHDQPLLFNPYFRGGNVGAIRGTGLGLSIAREIIEQQGGTITCESTPGVGTTFIVELPLRDPSEPSNL